MRLREYDLEPSNMTLISCTDVEAIRVYSFLFIGLLANNFVDKKTKKAPTSTSIM